MYVSHITSHKTNSNPHQGKDNTFWQHFKWQFMLSNIYIYFSLNVYFHFVNLIGSTQI